MGGLVALLGLAAGSVHAQDVLVLRDGTRRTGQLRACIFEGPCRLDGLEIGRAEIAWIGLGEQGTPPTPTDPTRDEVWLRHHGAQPGPLVGISLGAVATDADSFDREDVSWVYVGSAAGLPPPVPAVASSEPTAPRAPPESPGAAFPTTPPVAGAAPAPATTPAAPSLTPPPAPAASLLLNEVRFLPGKGQAPFVEIENASADAVPLEGVSLRNEKGKTFALPKGRTLEPGGFLVVLFDGAKGAEPGVVHAPATAFLGESGALWLRTGEGLADGVAWGLPSLSSVDLCRGGRCSAPPPGSVIARLPGVARAMAPAAWALLDPELATPGAPNPRPPVSAFAGLPGMIFAGPPRFSWYSVPGAAGYRLQVAREEAFSVVLHETRVDGVGSSRLEQVTVHGPALPPGDYFWRVQALGAGGEGAEPSRPIPFSVAPLRSAPPRSAHVLGSPAGSSARSWGDGAEAAAPPEPPATDDVREELAVPIIKHRKDTRMLTLEAPNERSPMGWDSPDQAGYPYCARAGVAMVNAFYGGKLSQDRIGYEAFKDLVVDAPEYDLPVVGMADHRTSRYTLPHALGTSGEYRKNPSFGTHDSAGCMDYEEGECARRGWEVFSEECRGYITEEATCPPEIAWPWGAEAMLRIRQEIDAGRPLIATTPSHLFLIVGYAQEGERFVIVSQDAGGREDVAANAAGLQQSFDSYWTGLAPVNVRSDEPGIAADGDGDGLVDFDETERFGTELDKPDSDGDGVDDKEEIRYSVWDPDHGYHRSVASLDPTGSDLAVESAAGRAQREPMELMPDSDNGGCQDGEEDLNADGRRTPDETSNFERADDPTSEAGTCLEAWWGTAQARWWTPGEDGQEITARFDLRLREIDRHPLIDPGPERGGRELGARIGSTVRFRCDGSTVTETFSSRGGCTCHGQGSKTIGPHPHNIDAFIVRKSVDWDLTPILGYDVPRGSGFYVAACGRLEEEDLVISCSCTGSYQPPPYPAPFSVATLSRDPTVGPQHLGDPEARYLDGGGNRMTGSYSVRDSSNNGVAVTWSLCRAGTPCGPPAPLPGVGGEPQASGEAAPPPP